MEQEIRELVSKVGTRRQDRAMRGGSRKESRRGTKGKNPKQDEKTTERNGQQYEIHIILHYFEKCIKWVY